ncbi:hypothetical protein IGI04_023918 [Brassica rapa subsp. trilocularis]|uniref:Uncharacterized protein n=1 Tax=Brassica rapa subsp. trilocularis TaxID=1813537 RepID=A0ABQ7M7S4_BRACM|nr:hypothetical protein IGI04_023918 [Brassica rapa subsp. trilocularis]
MAQAHKLNGATTVHTSSQTLAYPRVEPLASRRLASADHHIGTPNAKNQGSEEETETGKAPEKNPTSSPEEKVRLGARSQRIHRSCWCTVGAKSRPIDSEEDVVVGTGARSTGDLSR